MSFQKILKGINFIYSWFCMLLIPRLVRIATEVVVFTQKTIIILGGGVICFLHVGLVLLHLDVDNMFNNNMIIICFNVFVLQRAHSHFMNKNNLHLKFRLIKKHCT